MNHLEEMSVEDRDASLGRILVVEDDARIAGLVRGALLRCGFEVDSVSDGVEALERLERGRYDLTVLDLLLPELDGFSVLRRLSELRADQEVLVLSALSDVRSKVRCFELGASDYMEKPFALEELVARVRTRVRQGKERRSARFLEYGPLLLDLQRHTVMLEGRRVPLTIREFRLLEYLLHRHGEICSHEELLEYVWGLSHHPGTNLVGAYVWRLRTKLGKRFIETARAAGYSVP